MAWHKSLVAVMALVLGAAANATAAAPKSDDPVGQWKATTGDPKEAGSFYSIMVLDLKKDGTATLSNTMPDMQVKGGKQIVNKSIGKWKLEGDKVNLTLEKSEDGKEIPEDQRKLPLKLAADGKSLTNPEMGEVAFKKQEKEAK
jgi:hypothetical protein